jgi:hypothetical protein
MEDLNKAIARIKKLREVTVENGCSETEQYLAMAKINDLKELYGLTDEAIDMSKRRCSRSMSSKASPRHALLGVFRAHFGVAIILQQQLDRKFYPVVYGKSEVVELAAFAIDSAQSAFDKEVRRFKKGDAQYLRKRSDKGRRKLVEDYELALAVELQDKYPPKDDWQSDADAAKSFCECDFPEAQSIKQKKMGGGNDMSAAAARAELNLNEGIEAENRTRIGRW